MRNFYLLVLFGFFCLTANAQNTLAKLNYEDAEEAFAKGDFKTTLGKLTQAEKLLRASNSKILYLKIQAQNGLFMSGVRDNYSELDALRENCQFYLKEYEQVTGIEEKYRGIYRISENLKAYPTSEESFNIERNGREVKMLSLRKVFQFADSLSAIYKFKRGMSGNELLSSNPSIDNNVLTKYSTSIAGLAVTSYFKQPSLSRKNVFQVGFAGYTINANFNVVMIGWLLDGFETANNAIDYIRANFPANSYRMSKMKFSGKDCMIINVPRKDNLDEIDYYIYITVSEFQTSSVSSFNIVTDKRLLFPAID